MSEGLGRRQFLEGILATGIAISLAPEAAAQDTKKRITYELAKKLDDAGRQKYLEQVLRDEWKLVYDEKKNTEGFLSSYFWCNKKQRDTATGRIREEYKSEGIAKDAEDVIKKYDAALTIDVRCSGLPGTLKGKGYLVVGKQLFEYEHEDQLLTTLDFIAAYARIQEKGFFIDGKHADFAKDSWNTYKNILPALAGYYAQLSAIFSGKRKKVSESETAKAKANYAEFYTACRTQYEKTKEIAAKVTIKEYQEAADAMSAYFKTLDTTMNAFGYEHKLIQGKDGLFELAKLNK